MRETDIVTKKHLFRLAASPDGLAMDTIDGVQRIGLIEIKCPKTKINYSLDAG